MVVYGGKLKDSVNWLGLRKELNLKYPELAKSVVFIAKLHYDESYPDWDDYIKTVSENEDQLDNYSLNGYANTVFLQCKDISNIKQAIRWCHKFLKEDGKNPNYITTYANLLYKSGQAKKAIKTYEELIKSGRDSYGSLSEVIKKMKQGEKTW